MNIDACVTLGRERETILGAAKLLRKMDRAGVDRVVIQTEDRLLAVNPQRGNRTMLRAAAKYPDRLIATCSANPWFGKKAIASILDTIRAGARMVVFAPSLQGFILGDEILFPVLDAIADKHIPVYVHTGPHLHSSPWQLVSVAERYPTLPFIMGHCGATDFWNDVPNAASSAPNIYLESSFARPFSFKAHLSKVGMAKGIVGSGAPRNDLEFEWQQMREIFPPAQHADLYGGTLERLLNEVKP